MSSNGSYVHVNKVQFENHRSGRTLSSVYPSCLLFFSKTALSISSQSDTWFRRLFRFVLLHGHMCKKHGRRIAKYWWDTEKAIQAMMESRIKRRAKWASHKPSFASTLLHSYSAALLSFPPPPQSVTGSNTQRFYWASVFFRAKFRCVLKAIYNSVPE